MDLYTEEQAAQALEESIETKKEFLKEIETLDTMIFILRYFLATGDPLNPEAFDLEEPEGDSDD